MRTLLVLCLVATACAQYNYGSSGSSKLLGSSSAPAPVVGGVHKEFYYFTAPEGLLDDPHASEILAAASKKKIRVIFIKNPENKAYEDAVAKLVKQAMEQRTAIYVLTKQPDLNELANKFNAIRSNVNAKPEVHFVKYRTPEDAANAQRAIQSQYDSLGGTSQNFNGGVAPVINFASAAQNYGKQSAASTAVPAQSPESIYLPSAILRKYRTQRRV
ncbi:uncharacterized protein LOC133326210 [Musca vetustissima]|uniref:uncharacterized protein LOC133326210 n=1 Tax=Musca vetustissima TaxID=27455 RepID=UPI002AB75B74|nr:uncharacterized protein LOC133326210 [Musca vetustissima]